jgi:hypothetical protein
VDAPVELPVAPDPDPYRDPISLAVVDEVYERGEREELESPGRALVDR